MIGKNVFAIILLQALVVAHVSARPIETVGTNPGDYRGEFRGDFNGDGKADLLVRNNETGRWYMYLLDGSDILSEGFVDATSNYIFVLRSVADYDGDGKDDLLLWDIGTRRWYLLLMNGRTVRSQGFLPLTSNYEWELRHAGDLDGDGRTDLVMRNWMTGRWYAYLVNGLRVKDQGFLPVTSNFSWGISWLADLNGDGKQDLVLRNYDTGRWFAHLLNGLSEISKGFLTLPDDFAWGQEEMYRSGLTFIGDLNGDNTDDLLLRNSETGRWYAYLMNGLGFRRQGFVDATSNPDWTFMSLEDFSGDGRKDLLLRNRNSGQWYAYILNGVGIPREGLLDITSRLEWEAISLAADSDTGGGQLLLRDWDGGSWFNVTLAGTEVLGQDFIEATENKDWLPSSTLLWPFGNGFYFISSNWFGWNAADRDLDGAADYRDAFPDNQREWRDGDGDGVGDNEDRFPDDPSEQYDSDNDGSGDNSDNCPFAYNFEQLDSNGDGVGDACSLFPSSTNHPTASPIVRGTDGTQRLTSWLDSQLRVHTAWVEQDPSPQGLELLSYCRFDSGVASFCQGVYDSWSQLTGIDMVVDNGGSAHISMHAMAQAQPGVPGTEAPAVAYLRIDDAPFYYARYLRKTRNAARADDPADEGAQSSTMISIDESGFPSVYYRTQASVLNDNQVSLNVLQGLNERGAAWEVATPVFNETAVLDALDPPGTPKVLLPYDTAPVRAAADAPYFATVETTGDAPVFSGVDEDGNPALFPIEGYQNAGDNENRDVQVLGAIGEISRVAWWYTDAQGTAHWVRALLFPNGDTWVFSDRELVNQPTGAYLPCAWDPVNDDYVCVIQTGGADPKIYLLHDGDGDSVYVEELLGLTIDLGVISGRQSIGLRAGVVSFVGVSGSSEITVTRIFLNPDK